MLGLDTTGMYLPYEALPKENILKLPALLANTKETLNHHTGNVSISGKLDNLNVRLNGHSVNIEGSITKYKCGNNWEKLSFGEMQRTFESLSDRLNLPIERAIITRIDLGVNLFMDYHESLYMDLLDYCPRFKKLPFENGVYFTQKEKLFLFYGKEQEQKEKGQIIPNLYKNRNTLRYEMRWKKGLAKQFNTSSLQIQTLCQESFYIDLVNRMKNAYFNVKKHKINTVALESMGSKTITDYLLLKGVNAEFGSIGNALAYIKKANKSGVFDNKMQVSRLRTKLKGLYENPDLTQENDLALELDAKIIEGLKNYL